MADAPTSEWHIRALLADDIAATRAMLLAVWHATYDPIYGAARVNEIVARYHAAATLTAQAANATASLIAVIGSDCAQQTPAADVLGHVHVTTDPDAPAGLRIWRLYVADHAQRRGIGSALLAAAVARDPTRHLHRLDVHPANTAAIAFYRRHGFSIASHIGRPDDLTDPEALVMTRHLRPSE